MDGLQDLPAVHSLVSRQLALWPQHAKFLDVSCANRPAEVWQVSEQTADLILRLANRSPQGLDGFCQDYRFLCERIVLPEELHFRRYGRYRLSSFADAYREVYSNRENMGRYMAGLLVSNVLWDPHARAMAHFVNCYLPALLEGTEHLEIGPGHGLLLYFASCAPAVRSVVGWDISPTSISQTAEALDTMGIDRPVDLKLRDLFAATETNCFDSVVLSEILEHLEDPLAALRSVHTILRPAGRVWINVPVNSPAPDHIYLLRTPEEACELVEAGGFQIIDSCFFPVAGRTLEQARRVAASISCVITAQRI